MTDARQQFHSTLAPDAVFERFEQLASERDWKVTKRDDGEIEAKQGMTLKSASEKIRLWAEPDGDGAQVTVEASSWQLTDWGEGNDLAAELRSKLNG